MPEERGDRRLATDRGPTPWERAYQAFETPEQEVQKFVDRFRRIGVDDWDRSSSVLEVCSGRGSGLEAWNSLGFLRTWRGGWSAGRLTGVTGIGWGLYRWYLADFGPLDYASTMRLILPASTLVALGGSLALNSFLCSMLGLDRR